ncbi:MAG: sigma-70 family RNA polymerase sigma factor [Verrucomicrobiota bacterium]|jgi:RNA polymerase sigma-70 factor (ECF subfamily)
MAHLEDNSYTAESSRPPAGGAGNFTATNWSMVLEAGRGDGPRAADALERLCRIYWYPIYAFIRRRGADRFHAEDLTQSFFALLLAKEMLKKVERQKGKFRSFLLAGVTNFMANEWDKQQTQKRGGGRQIISLDETTAAEELYQHEPVEPYPPEKLFDRSWAFTLLDRVLARLKQEYAAADKATFFATLEPYLTREMTPGSYGVPVAELHLSEGAVKVALHRLRRRFGELLRTEIAQTVSRPEEVDEEIRCLFAAISTA